MFNNEKDMLITPTTGVNMDLFWDDAYSKTSDSINSTFDDSWLSKTQSTHLSMQSGSSSSALNDSTFGITSEMKNKCKLSDDEFEMATSNLKRKRGKVSFSNDLMREPLRDISNAPNVTSPTKKKRKKLAVINLEAKREFGTTLHVVSDQTVFGVPESCFATIQSALSAAKPYDTIVIHEGKYILETRLDIDVMGVHLKGVSKENVLVIGTSSSSVINVTVDHVTISNVAIRHDKPGYQSTKKGTNFSLVSIECGKTSESFQTQIDDCDLSLSIEHGIAVLGWAQPVITNCRIHHCKKIGLFFHQYASGIVDHNLIYSNGYEGMTFRAYSHPIVKHNKIIDGVAGGVYIRDSSHPHLIDNEISNNTLSGICITNKARPHLKLNSVRGNKQNGIVFKNESAGVMEENIVSGNQYPNVYINDDCETEINNNKIFGGKSFGIWLKGKSKPKITNNEIYDNLGKNILVTEHGRPTFSSNRIYMSNGIKQEEELRGVVLKDACKPVFELDEVYGHSSSGFDVGGRAAPQLFGCKIYENAKNGVLIRDYSTPVVTECSISSNGYPNIIATDRSDATISKTQIFSGAQTGVTVKGTPRVILKECDIHSNSFSNVKIGGHSYTEVIKCVVFKGKQSGIWVKDSARGKIDQCVFHGNRRDNIFVELTAFGVEIGNNESQ